MAAEGSSRKSRKQGFAAAAKVKEEQDGLINAFLVFGHDWREGEDVGGAKTRNRKYWAKVRQNGQMMHVPTPHPRGKNAASYLHNVSGVAINCNQSICNGSSSSSWPTCGVPNGSSHSSQPDFAEAYSFIGDLFDPDNKCASEVHLQRLKEMDPITAKTVLLLMQNLTNNISSPDFERLRRCLSTYDEKTQTIDHNGCCSTEHDI